MLTKLFLILSLSAVAWGCPDEALCANEDCGSCGNSCCKLQVTVSEDTATAMAKLNATMDGGPDGHYTLSVTYEGPTGFADLRPYDKPVDFLGQATHMTYAPNYFNDTLDFTIAPTEDGGSLIQAFSISQIAGAYCDEGQNYFNLVQVLNAVDWDSGYQGGDAGIDGSCGKPSA